MSEKRVLVIEEGKRGEFWNDCINLSSKKFWEKYSPGNLLASFKTEVMYNTKRGELGINLPFEVQNKLISNRVDTNITVLIVEEK